VQALHFLDYRKDKWKSIWNVNYNKNTKSASVALFTSNKNQAFILKYNKIPKSASVALLGIDEEFLTTYQL
jgi:hypothetical protein